MKKTLFLLVVGVAIGYWLGWGDAQTNTDNALVRVVNRVGGKHRADLRSDPDRQLDSLEH